MSLAPVSHARKILTWSTGRKVGLVGHDHAADGGVFLFKKKQKTMPCSRSRAFSAPCCNWQSNGRLPSLVVYYGSFIDRWLQLQPLCHNSGWAQALQLHSAATAPANKKNAAAFVFLKGKKDMPQHILIHRISQVGYALISDCDSALTLLPQCLPLFFSTVTLQCEGTHHKHALIP